MMIMKLAEAIKLYAGTRRTDQSLFRYLETETKIAHFDPDVDVENITEEWFALFKDFAGKKHAGNVRRAMKNFR